jgi:hypothetical protein
LTPRDFPLRGLLLSLAVHGAIAALMFGAVWGVRHRPEALPPVVLTADFMNPSGRVVEAANAATDRSERLAPTEEPIEARSTDALAERLRELERNAGAAPALDALAARFNAASMAGIDAGDARRSAQTGASFAGLVAGNATKVAYVVDASGSMVGSFPAIVDEVERSLARLEPSQQFTVICFRKDGAVAPRGSTELRPASRDERAAAVRWLREEIVPAGRSNPLEAIALALSSGADCVFLLSSARTGPGSHDLDRASTLALLDRLNPRREAPRGRDGGPRRASIQCIQFLEEDPGGTLEAIAAEHFGEGGYRFIPRSATTLGSAGADSEGDRR